MAHLVEVAFKGNRKEFYRWSADDPPAAGAFEPRVEGRIRSEGG